jgi:tRNA (mo5U34)-methyltransferase
MTKDSLTLYESTFAEKLFYNREDLLQKLAQDTLSPELQAKRKKALNLIERPAWEQVLSLFSQLPKIPGAGFSVGQGIVSAGSAEMFSAFEKVQIEELVSALLPWRKGPWSLAGIEIDSEWRSNWKFDSFAELFPEFRDKTVLDIGSGNGYYAARLLEQGAQAVVCLDPSERFLLQFELFQKFAKDDRMQLELLGFEDAPTLGVLFDVVFCMGVLYHQKNPLAVIESCRDALKPGGMLVLESMTYPSQDSIAFFPPDRYAKARNVYFLPSVKAMISMCKRVGFKSVELVNERVISLQEQRITRLAPYESLAEFLDPNDISKTIEGHPAPQRALIVARR